MCWGRPRPVNPLICLMVETGVSHTQHAAGVLGDYDLGFVPQGPAPRSRCAERNGHSWNLAPDSPSLRLLFRAHVRDGQWSHGPILPACPRQPEGQQALGVLAGEGTFRRCRAAAQRSPGGTTPRPPGDSPSLTHPSWGQCMRRYFPQTFWVVATSPPSHFGHCLIKIFIKYQISKA